MFSNIIKNFFLKRIVSKKLSNYYLEISTDKIKSVGVLIEDAYFKDRKGLIAEIERFGIAKDNIEILTYKNNKKEVTQEPFFTLNDISFSGNVKKKEVEDFISTPFDLLINYYEVNDSVLLLLSKKSKAKFKVGFASVDNRINSFMIDLHIHQYKEFVAELFKYIKILNKL
jgi:hypothetical protein